MNDTFEGINIDEERTRAARRVGRQTFFEIAERQGLAEATDTMRRVVEMSPLLASQDVANWRKMYEDLEAQDNA